MEISDMGEFKSKDYCREKRAIENLQVGGKKSTAAGKWGFGHGA